MVQAGEDSGGGEWKVTAVLEHPLIKHLLGAECHVPAM